MMNAQSSQLLPAGSCRARGFLMMDLMIGMAILTVAFLPLACSFVHDWHLLRLEYYRANAMEIVDGEMEVLAAGEWRDFPDGSHVYKVRARAAASLPPGQFRLSKTGKHLRLEWKSDTPRGIGNIVREITVR